VPCHFCFLHYRNNNADIVRKADNSDRLWKIRTIFDILNDAYENYYNPSEELSADEIIVKFKGRAGLPRLLLGESYKGEIQLDDAEVKAMYTSSR
jgi:hypothetical protein